MLNPTLSAHSALQIDAERESALIIEEMREHVHRRQRCGGVVIGVSGGIDSAVALALAVRAFTPKRVVALALPEVDSEPQSGSLARQLCDKFGVELITEEIAPALVGLGCYARRDEAVRRVFPEFDASLGYQMRITLPPALQQGNVLNTFSLTIVRPNGEILTAPLPAPEYQQIVASSNFKQRTRMSMLYYHAELRNYAVIGTPNKDEHELGFFVRWGDGSYDYAPIIHLFKTQVYELASYLGVPSEICLRPPTTDTYSAPCTQEEFFFRLPFSTLDLIWSSMEDGRPAAEVAEALELSVEQVQWVTEDLARRVRSSAHVRTLARYATRCATSPRSD
jgi:NAD+ synthase